MTNMNDGLIPDAGFLTGKGQDSEQEEVTINHC